MKIPQRFYFCGEKPIIHLWFKVLPIARHYFLPSFGQRPNLLLKQLKRFTNFLPPHKTANAGHPNFVLLVKTTDSQSRQWLENVVNVIGLPISNRVLTLGWAFAHWKSTLSWFSSYCSYLSLNAPLKKQLTTFTHHSVRSAKTS